MIKKILVYPEDKEILTSKSEEVIEINDEVNDLIQDLTDTLNNTETGCGISAVQIGVLKRVCVIKPDSKTCFAMINPKITKKEGVCLFREGCLSAPHKQKKVQRAKKVSVEYIDENGERQRITRGGLTAIIIQHELDHFEGWCEVFDGEESEN